MRTKGRRWREKERSIRSNQVSWGESSHLYSSSCLRESGRTAFRGISLTWEGSQSKEGTWVELPPQRGTTHPEPKAPVALDGEWELRTAGLPWAFLARGRCPKAETVTNADHATGIGLGAPEPAAGRKEGGGTRPWLSPAEPNQAKRKGHKLLWHGLGLGLKCG